MYATAPIQQKWKAESVFEIVGFQVVIADEVMVELEDPDKRIVFLTKDIVEKIFQSEQRSLF